MTKVVKHSEPVLYGWDYLLEINDSLEVPQGPPGGHSYQQVFIWLCIILLLTTKARDSPLFRSGISLHQVNEHKLNTTDLPLPNDPCIHV